MKGLEEKLARPRCRKDGEGKYRVQPIGGGPVRGRACKTRTPQVTSTGEEKLKDLSPFEDKGDSAEWGRRREKEIERRDFYPQPEVRKNRGSPQQRRKSSARHRNFRLKVTEDVSSFEFGKRGLKGGALENVKERMV